MKQYQFSYYTYCILVLLGSLVFACKKDDNAVSFDNNSVNFVVADNFNLSAFNAALRVSNMDKELKTGKGPYTLLAPSDDAFSKAGYPSVVKILSERAAIISNIAYYHILDGKYELDKLPFLFNQELKTRKGKVYATHWVKGADTVLTLNGARVLTQNLPASNGLIQVLDRVMTPYVHDKIVDAINADASISIFARAIKRSGVLSDKVNQGPYTIFAPTNAAMAQMGFTSIQEIEKIGVAELKQVVNYHIVRDRRFVYDYILSTGNTNVSKQTMLDGNNVQIRLIPNANSPGAFSGIALRGLGNTSDVLLQKQDILTGDGVLHIVDQCLRITQ